MSLARLILFPSILLALLLPAAPSLGQDAESFAKLPASKSCRLIDFDKADVVPGIVPKTWFLTVSGTKPYINMRVDLNPLIYIRQPDYWGIEVVGCLMGPGLPTTMPYSVFLSLEGTIGTKGIEVIGATRSETKDIAHCSRGAGASPVRFGARGSRRRRDLCSGQ
jgi:hypothetical protein